ncbi:hypothetical protein OSTOST_04376 [Ostertagia ostertagi]
MRQTLFVLTAMAMDVVKQLRRLALLQAAGKQVDFTPSIDLARKLRNELNDRFLIVRSEKENENKYCVADLVHTVRILERDNRTLYENVKTWQKEYEALEKQHAENPEIAERIASQLRNIHSVMGEFRRTCGQLKEPSNGGKHKKGCPDSVTNSTCLKWLPQVSSVIRLVYSSLGFLCNNTGITLLIPFFTLCLMFCAIIRH